MCQTVTLLVSRQVLSWTEHVDRSGRRFWLAKEGVKSVVWFEERCGGVKFSIIVRKKKLKAVKHTFVDLM